MYATATVGCTVVHVCVSSTCRAYVIQLCTCIRWCNCFPSWLALLCSQVVPTVVCCVRQVYRCSQPPPSSDWVHWSPHPALSGRRFQLSHLDCTSRFFCNPPPRPIRPCTVSGELLEPALNSWTNSPESAMHQGANALRADRSASAAALLLGTWQCLESTHRDCIARVAPEVDFARSAQVHARLPVPAANSSEHLNCRLRHLFRRSFGHLYNTGALFSSAAQPAGRIQHFSFDDKETEGLWCFIARDMRASRDARCTCSAAMVRRRQRAAAVVGKICKLLSLG